jgi:hypothetical protein
VAVLAMMTLPDYPETTKWLVDDKCILAISRLAEEGNEKDHDEANSDFESLKIACPDPVPYIIWLMQLGLTTCARFINFFPTIVEALGHGTTETLLLSALAYMFAEILSLINSLHSDQVSER